MEREHDDYFERFSYWLKPIQVAHLQKLLQGKNYRFMPADEVKRKSGSVTQYMKKKNESKRSNMDNDSSYIGRKSSIDNISSKNSDSFTPVGSKLNYSGPSGMDGHFGMKRPMLSQNGPNEHEQSPPSITSKSQSAIEPPMSTENI